MNSIKIQKKMYKAGKNWVIAAAVAVAGVALATQAPVFADDNQAPQTEWRGKSVEDAKNAAAEAGKSYQILDGDSLSTIAEHTGVSIESLQAANDLDDNAVLTPGETLKVDGAATLPEETTAEASTQDADSDYSNASSAVSAPATVTTVSHSDASGQANTYMAGQCTWFVKNSLAWVPNTFGNAYEWAAKAAAQGYRVDNTPEVGAVAVYAPGVAYASAFGHVAVVASVNGGSITISEMTNFVASSGRSTSTAGVLFIHQH
jgi:surface antigen